jgi:hypothetical protein
MLKKNRNLSLLTAALIGLFLVGALSAQSGSLGSPADQWSIAGQNLSNTWSQPAEHKISPANVQDLSPKWVLLLLLGASLGGFHYSS